MTSSAQVRYPGLAIIEAKGTVSRGITPTVFAVTVLPQDGLQVGPGTLTFEYGNAGVNFPDAAVAVGHLRTAQMGGQRWELEVLDHRWRWSFGGLSVDWNRRLPDGSVDPATKKNPQEMAAALLSAMGEVGYDVSRLPTNVYPRLVGDFVPARALNWLCEYVGCVITGGEFARVTIYPIGIGGSLPDNADRRYPIFRRTTDARPSSLAVLGGPTVYQTKLKLAAIGREQDGSTVAVNELSYDPGWSTESPFSLYSVTGSDRPGALETLWRQFRVVGQADGSLAVPGCQEAIGSVAQYFPLQGELLDYGEDPDGVNRSLAAYLEGTYYPYCDQATNCDAHTRFVGDWKLLGDRGVAQLPFPLWKFSSSASIEEPELYLTATYNVRSADGTRVDRLLRTRNLGGSGGALGLVRPELFRSVKASYSTTVPTNLSTNSTAETEADAYLELFARRYASATMLDQEYVGVQNVPLDGNVAQVRYVGSARPNRFFTTRASTHYEFDVYGPSEKERRRREALDLVRDRLNV